ncbi:FAD-binding oxidoreductase [Thalassotalea piscium]
MTNEIKAQLTAILGDDYIFDDTQSCVLYSQDVYTKALPAMLVIKPTSSQVLAQAVKLITEAGIAIIPRGGGMSYTKGFVPAEKGSIIVDTSLLNEIIEVNTEDMYVRVQSGCTWKKLHETLKSTGFRTPFWGTLSGSRATVGGGLSQNGIFWGSGQHGFAVDSVISLEVVLANGDIINTGSGAQINGTPFMRHYGPDLTGIFCTDNAALGIKTTVTLRLIAQLPHNDGVSFCFETFAQQSAVMSEVARQGLASETCGFDPYLQAQRLKRESLASDVKSLMGVMKSAGGIGKALKQGAKVALAGRNFVEAESWSVHFIVEDRTEAAVKERLNAIREIASKHEASEIENTIPKVLRANPFGPVNNMIGPNGERWAPVHTLVPHSKAQLAYQKTSEIFDNHKAAIDKYNIGIGYLLASVSSNVFVLEPVFFWPDELNELHHHAIEPQHIKRVKTFAASPEARAAVQAIREDLIVSYKNLGGVHMQIGKTYLFEEGICDTNFKLLKEIKALVDPNNRMNPTALGL